MLCVQAAMSCRSQRKIWVGFWAVATRPVAENGLGLTVEQAIKEVSALKSLFVVLPEMPLKANGSAWLRNIVCLERVSHTTLELSPL